MQPLERRVPGSCARGGGARACFRSQGVQSHFFFSFLCLRRLHCGWSSRRRRRRKATMHLDSFALPTRRVPLGPIGFRGVCGWLQVIMGSLCRCYGAIPVDRDVGCVFLLIVGDQETQERVHSIWLRDWCKAYRSFACLLSYCSAPTWVTHVAFASQNGLVRIIFTTSRSCHHFPYGNNTERTER